jgi:hypothetical protein
LGLIGGVWYYTVREQHRGEAKIEAEDKGAQAKIAALVASQTAELKAKADMADQAAEVSEGRAADAEAKLNAYIASVGGIRLCHPNSGGPRVSQTPTSTRPASGQSPSAGAIPAVPAGDSSPDLSDDLDTLVSAAAELAIDVQEFQSR